MQLSLKMVHEATIMVVKTKEDLQFFGIKNRLLSNYFSLLGICLESAI